ncbi:MAG: hypothetical protein AUI14_20125, partial [Actinobacteria bacterium 13_2_20CM_2_71_6]
MDPAAAGHRRQRQLQHQGGPLTRRESAARARILDTATGLFYVHGIRGVGIDAIVAASGVAKATLYAHFPSKEDLVLAYLARSDEAWRGKLRAAADAAGPDPRDQLVGLFDALHEACVRDGFRGCPFINTAAESPPGSAVHGATVAHKQVVRAWVAQLATQAGATDPDGLARALTVILDGAMAAGALEPTPDLARQARQVASTLVDAACAPADGAPAGGAAP